MIVFIEKVRVRSGFTIINPIVTEPLELFYIREVLNQEGIENYIIDPFFKLESPINIIPDLVILNGYNVSEDMIIKRAREYKRNYTRVKTLVSGVHAQINRESFRVSGVDFVFFSQSLESFRSFISKKEVKGMDYFDENTKRWIVGGDDILVNAQNILPDRSIFNDFRADTKYIDKRNVSLIKGSHGCPFKCSFCYCRLLNSSTYIKANYDEMFKEMMKINSSYFWIVDDSLFIRREDALEFIYISREYKFNKKIIAYLRADFIIENKDLLEDLKACGLDEVIIGFESPDSRTLNEYNKSLNASIYRSVVQLLNENNIDLTALFIVDPNYSIKDFFTLNKFIKDSHIGIYTISIMTPMKGTKDYLEKEKILLTKNPLKFDFLHLVVPSKLPRFVFYSLFYLNHLGLLKSKRIRKMLKDSLIKGKLWDFWAKRYHKLWVQKYSLKPTRDRIKAIIQKQDYRSKKLLDLGCGTGQLLLELEGLEGLKLYGLDFSKAMIEESKKLNRTVNHYHLDIEDINTISEKFDIITCSHSLPYYKNKRRVFENISTVLRDEGKLHLAFASGESIMDKIILLFVKLTTGPAKYPSDSEIRKLIDGIFQVEAYEIIKEKFFMPTIALYTLKKVEK